MRKILSLSISLLLYTSVSYAQTQPSMENLILGAVQQSMIGAPNGVAPLVNGVVPAVNLPPVNGSSGITGLTGDVTTPASSTGSTVATLASVATPGTYTKVTVNVKGLVTAGFAQGLTDLPTIGAGTILGNVTGSSNTPTAVATNTANGVPLLNGSGQFLAAQIPLATISATGGVASGGATGKAWNPVDGWFTPAGSGGGITSITAGSGLSGGTITTSGTIALVFGTTAGTAVQGNDSRLSSFTSTTPGIVPASGGGTTNFLRADGTFAAPAGGGSGTVTSTSVVPANGFGGTVANPTTTPAITLSTSVTGLLKGNGTGVSAAVAGTDYVTPTGSGAGLSGITVGQVSGAQPTLPSATTSQVYAGSGFAGNTTSLTQVQLTALINAATTSLSGAIPSGGGTGKAWNPVDGWFTSGLPLAGGTLTGPVAWSSGAAQTLTNLGGVAAASVGQPLGPALLDASGKVLATSIANRATITPLVTTVGTTATTIYPNPSTLAGGSYVSVVITNNKAGSLMTCSGTGVAPSLSTGTLAYYGQSIYWPAAGGGTMPTAPIQCIATVTTTIITEAH